MQPTLALGFVAAAVAVGLLAAANAAVAGLVGVHGTELGQGMIELVTIGVPTLLAFGALHHWAKKLFGAPLSGPAGALALLSSLGGTLAIGIGQSIAGYARSPVHAVEAEGDAKLGYALAEAGHVLLLLAGLLVTLDVFRALAARRTGRTTPADLGDGVTLEWAAPSPPPPGNFTQLPEVRSEAPLAGLAKAKGSKSGSKKRGSTRKGR